MTLNILHQKIKPLSTELNNELNKLISNVSRSDLDPELTKELRKCISALNKVIRNIENSQATPRMAPIPEETNLGLRYE